MNLVRKSHALFVSAQGLFFRAVTDIPKIDPLAGSIAAGRYSRPNQRTLYMSSSEDGVRAAMQAHPLPSGKERSTWQLLVDADHIADLRDDSVFSIIRMQQEDALGPWQPALAEGGVPSSWLVRDALEAIGAKGLIDPSRKVPGLWHLVLFEWNRPNAPQVRLGE